MNAAMAVTLWVTVHGPVRAPLPTTLPRRTLRCQVHANRQRCGEGLGEGKPAKWLHPAPLDCERSLCGTPTGAGHKDQGTKSQQDRRYGLRNDQPCKRRHGFLEVFFFQSKVENKKERIGITDAVGIRAEAQFTP